MKPLSDEKINESNRIVQGTISVELNFEIRAANYSHRIKWLDRRVGLQRAVVHRPGVVTVELDPVDRQIAVLLFFVVNAPAEIDLRRSFDRERQQDPHFVGNFISNGCTVRMVEG